jgi:pyrroloquinoline quinone (PQQ) biosynthesis protein C
MKLSAKRVRLSPACRIHAGEKDLIVETREFEVRVTVQGAALIADALIQLTHSGVPRELVSSEQAPASVLDPLLEMLLEDDLLIDESRVSDDDKESETVGDRESAGNLIAEARFYARQVFEQPFWVDLLAGRLSRGQIFAWGVEFYHFVDAANIYMPLGVAHARTRRAARAMLARHYVEEMNHQRIFLDGLAQCGLDVEEILGSRPLPHTAALINLLSEAAIEGEVTYAAGFAVMQAGARSSDSEFIDDFYKHLSNVYPYAECMFEAFRRHAVIDLDLRHDDTVFHHVCD